MRCAIQFRISLPKHTEYKIVILLALLYGCEIWPLNLMKEHTRGCLGTGFRVECLDLRGRKKPEVWVEFYNLYPSPDVRRLRGRSNQGRPDKLSDYCMYHFF
jgi:hypothetical protein